MGYAKNNALKGLKFASLGEQNAHLGHWETQVADQRVHGTTRRQVAAMFEEERKALAPLPASLYESYREGRRRVRRDGFVEVEKAYYEAPPEFVRRRVWVRWDGRMVRLFNERMEQIGAHPRQEPGKFSRCLGVRGLRGSIGESASYWRSRAEALGEAAGRWARRALETRGAEAIRSLMALCHLADKRRAADIDAACAKAMAAASGQPPPGPPRSSGTPTRVRSDASSADQTSGDHPPSAAATTSGPQVRSRMSAATCPTRSASSVT